jgi:hypothetical protein
MAVLTVQAVSRTGITPSYAAAAGGGDSFVNDGDCFVHIKNGGGAPITLTVAVQAKVMGLTITNIALSVTNAQERMIGPFPPDLFNDAGGSVQLTYSGVTTVTTGVFSLKKP